jgi:hypothetical protein
MAGVTGLSSQSRARIVNVSLVLTLIHMLSTSRCWTNSNI